MLWPSGDIVTNKMDNFSEFWMQNALSHFSTIISVILIQTAQILLYFLHQLLIMGIIAKCPFCKVFPSQLNVVNYKRWV